MYVIKIFLLSIFITSIFVNIKFINEASFALGLYFLFRMLTDYRKCTLSYIECKIRNVDKKQGHINKILNNLIDYNKKSYRFFIYIFLIFIISINYYKLNIFFILYAKKDKE